MSKNWLKGAIKKSSTPAKTGKSIRGFIKGHKGKDTRTLRQINLAKTLNKIRGGK
jgi:hypothetical protein